MNLNFTQPQSDWGLDFAKQLTGNVASPGVDFNTQFNVPNITPNMPEFSGMTNYGQNMANNLTGDLSGNFNAVPNTGTPASGNPFMDWMFGSTNANGVRTQGNLMPALGAASGLAQSWLGFKNLGLQKDQFNFQKGAFNDQYNQQVAQYNTSIEDRANARLGLTDQERTAYVNKNSLEGRNA